MENKLQSKKINVILVVIVILLTVVIFIQGRSIRNQTILFAHDIGISELMYYEILHVKYDSFYPNYKYESENPSEIIDVIKTLQNAVFVPVSRPRKINWIDSFYLENTHSNYDIGLYNGSIFRIEVDGIVNYYRSSAVNMFL